MQAGSLLLYTTLRSLLKCFKCVGLCF